MGLFGRSGGGSAREKKSGKAKGAAKAPYWQIDELLNIGDSGMSRGDGTTFSEDPDMTYELLKRLDKGASGEVWLAEDRYSGEQLAIKVIPLEAELMDEVRAEVGALGKCSDCEAIVQYHGSYKKDDAIWIVMEFADVGSLQDYMSICLKPLNEGEIASVMASIIVGLAYLHEVGIVHRDVKAKNVLLNTKGRVKLADFGVSGLLASKQARRKTAIGSPHWMAPEVIIEHAYDGRADVWSAGITLMELAEMEPPYADTPLHTLLNSIPTSPPPTLAEPDDWSEGMRDFLSKCLVVDPEQRATSAELLAHPFIAAEVQRQEAGDFGLLRTMVKDSISRIQWYRDASHDAKAEEKAIKKLERGNSYKALENANDDLDTEDDVDENGVKYDRRSRVSIASSASSSSSNSRISLVQERSLMLSRSKSIGNMSAASRTSRMSRISRSIKNRPDLEQMKSRRMSKKDAIKKRFSLSLRKSRSGVLDDDQLASASEEEKNALAERDRKAKELKDRLLRLYARNDNP